MEFFVSYQWRCDQCGVRNEDTYQNQLPEIPKPSFKGWVIYNNSIYCPVCMDKAIKYLNRCKKKIK